MCVSRHRHPGLQPVVDRDRRPRDPSRRGAMLNSFQKRALRRNDSHSDKKDESDEYAPKQRVGKNLLGCFIILLLLTETLAYSLSAARHRRFIRRTVCLFSLLSRGASYARSRAGRAAARDRDQQVDQEVERPHGLYRADHGSV